MISIIVYIYLLLTTVEEYSYAKLKIQKVEYVNRIVIFKLGVRMEHVKFDDNVNGKARTQQ